MKAYFILNGLGEYFSEDERGVQFMKSVMEATFYPSLETAEQVMYFYKDYERFEHETWRIYEIDLAKAIRVA